MRIVALLNWYEEPAAWLAETVASLKFCDHLIAVDGPYALFPGALRKPASAPDQIETIQRVAAGLRLGCTIHVPRQPWWGNEVEKRNFMFQLGNPMTEPGDWYLVIDADEVVTHAPSDLRQRLEATTLDVAELTLWERESQHKVAALVDTSSDYRSPLRRLFRALPDIAVIQAHYVVTSGHRVLAGNTDVHTLEPAAPLHDVQLEHRRAHRSIGRLRLKDQYGHRREEVAPEKVSAI